MDINFLLVEDEMIAAEYLTTILEDLGFKNIYNACSAKEATDILNKHKIDLIFMDINIQGSKDGIQCAKEINKKIDIPIIYTTAYSDSNTINEASESNLYGYLIKPFNEKNVEVTLKVALNTLHKFKEVNKEKQKTKEEINLSSSLIYNFINKKLKEDNKIVNLTKREILLLDIFSKSPNTIVSYETLKQEIWNETISDSTIRDAVSKLKKKIKSAKLENISSIGYQLHI